MFFGHQQSFHHLHAAAFFCCRLQCCASTISITSSSIDVRLGHQQSFHHFHVPTSCRCLQCSLTIITTRSSINIRIGRQKYFHHLHVPTFCRSLQRLVNVRCCNIFEAKGIINNLGNSFAGCLDQKIAHVKCRHATGLRFSKTGYQGAMAFLQNVLRNKSFSTLFRFCCPWFHS